MRPSQIQQPQPVLNAAERSRRADHAANWAGRGDLERMIKEITEASLNYQDLGQALSTAAENGHIDVVRYLLSKNAHNAYNAHGGLNARRQRTVSVVMTTHSSYVPPLFGACKNGHSDIVKLLLENGVDPNVQTRTTALLEAMESGKSEIVKSLLDYGATVTVHINGTTPLHKACTSLAIQDTDILELLISRGADIHMTNGMGQTPLYWTCQRISAEKIKLLLEKGANVNVKDHQGDTPLLVLAKSDHQDTTTSIRTGGHRYKAISAGKERGFDLLLSYGADPNMKNNEGMSPWDYTEYRNYIAWKELDRIKKAVDKVEGKNGRHSSDKVSLKIKDLKSAANAQADVIAELKRDLDKASTDIREVLNELRDVKGRRAREISALRHEYDNNVAELTRELASIKESRTDAISCLNGNIEKCYADFNEVSQELKKVKEGYASDIAALRQDYKQAIAEITGGLASMKESHTDLNGKIEKLCENGFDVAKVTASIAETDNDLDEGIAKYFDYTKSIAEMMETHSRQLEERIQELPQIALTSGVSLTSGDNHIDWTAIDKTVFDFHTMMDHIRSKGQVVNEVHDYLKLTQNVDDDSQSPPLKDGVAKVIQSQLKCCRDQKLMLCNRLRQMENKLELDWEYIKKESGKLASLQLSLLEETNISQDPALFVDVQKLIHAKAAYVAAKEKWRRHKTKIEGYADDFDNCLIQKCEALESVLHKFHAESNKLAQTFTESLDSFKSSLNSSRKSLAEATKEVHHQLQLCEYRDPDLHHDLKVLSHDLERIFETEKVIDQITADLSRKSRNRVGENVGFEDRISEGIDINRSQLNAATYLEGNEAVRRESEASSNVGEEIKDNGSIGTIESSVSGWKLL